MAERTTITLRAGATTATIAPAAGGRVAQLDLGDGSILRPKERATSWHDWGCYPLLPWSNRLPGGLLELDDGVHRLPVDHEDGSALHGLAAHAPWTVEGATPSSAQLSLRATAGPYDVVGDLTHSVRPGSLRIDLAVRNVADRPVPVGLGVHPWFHAGPVRVPAAARWPGDPLPVGPPVDVGPDDDLRSARVPPPMDRCFTRLTGTTADVPGATLRWDGPVEDVVVYTGDAGWVAVEPVTMANDGFGLARRGVPGHGTRVLAPGDRLSATFWLERPVDRPAG
ncbi:aldose epimerase family protein [Dermatobacter hominis]|uniref:aldose epimerase family protein n=1 Tax=Dermatobacter hominis TaxID=2884263 RepID=UPI001D10E3FB|nr:hypothetical protein [Dermatobacter hominis]UDY35024.1 hypothetical protein LH044_17000 [Dermatobacter hominis]